MAGVSQRNRKGGGLKKPYNEEYLCPRHRDEREIAAVCQRCYSSAIGQQTRQWIAQREQEHQKYLARMPKAA